jgi:hypothetical protein
LIPITLHEWTLLKSSLMYFTIAGLKRAVGPSISWSWTKKEISPLDHIWDNTMVWKKKNKKNYNSNFIIKETQEQSEK